MILVALLGATMVAAWFAPEENNDLALPVSNGQPGLEVHAPADESTAVPTSPTVAIPAIVPRVVPNAPLALFSALLPFAPPAPEMTVSVAVPETPQVPPLPFLYLGRYVAEGVQVVFVSFNDRGHALRVGDVVDGQYRVKAINESQMVLIYLPLNQTQVLDIDPSL